MLRGVIPPPPWVTAYLVSILGLHGGVPGPVAVHHVLPTAYHHNAIIINFLDPLTLGPYIREYVVFYKACWVS